MQTRIEFETFEKQKNVFNYFSVCFGPHMAIPLNGFSHTPTCPQYCIFLVRQIGANENKSTKTVFGALNKDNVGGSTY